MWCSEHTLSSLHSIGDQVAHRQDKDAVKEKKLTRILPIIELATISSLDLPKYFGLCLAALFDHDQYISETELARLWTFRLTRAPHRGQCIFLVLEAFSDDCRISLLFFRLRFKISSVSDSRKTPKQNQISPAIARDRKREVDSFKTGYRF